MALWSMTRHTRQVVASSSATRPVLADGCGGTLLDKVLVGQAHGAPLSNLLPGGLHPHASAATRGNNSSSPPTPSNEQHGRSVPGGAGDWQQGTAVQIAALCGLLFPRVMALLCIPEWVEGLGCSQELYSMASNASVCSAAREHLLLGVCQAQQQFGVHK
jgi:hypothetical protein